MLLPISTVNVVWVMDPQFYWDRARRHLGRGGGNRGVVWCGKKKRWLFAAPESL